MTRQEIIARVEQIAAELKAIADNVPDEILEREFLQLAGEAEQTATDAQDETIEINW